MLAFPHGGRSGAAGLQADKGARLALEGSAFTALSIDLDSGVQNPHEDEGTDDERAVARVDAALGSYGTESNVVGAVTGPTQAIVRAALSAPVRFPVVGAVEGSSATLAQMPRALREEYHARYREPASVASWAGYQAARALLRRIGP